MVFLDDELRGKDTEEEYLIDNTQKSCCRRLSIFLERCQVGFYGLLFLVSKDVQSSLLIVYVTALVNSFQLLHFTFVNPDFPWHPFILQNFAPICEFFSFGFIRRLDGFVVLVAFSGVFSLLVVTCVLSSIIQAEFASGRVKSLHILPLLRFLLRLLTTVLYVPVVAFLFDALGCGTVLDDIFGCQTTGRYSLFVVILLLLCWFVGFAGLIILVVGQRDPTSADPGAGPHKRLEFINSIIRAFVEFCVSIQIDFLLGVVIATGIWLTFSYIYYLPYYSMKTNSIMVGSHAIYLWAGITVFFSQFVHLDVQNDLTSVLLFFLGAPFFMYSCILLTYYRAEKLSQCTPHEGMSPFIAEICLRLRHPNIKALDAREAYSKAVQMYAKSGFFNIQMSILCENVWEHKVNAKRYLYLAKDLRLGFDQQFVVHKSALFEKNNISSDAMSYIALDYHHHHANHFIGEAIQAIAAFWEYLQHSKMDESNMYKISKRVNMALEKSKEHIDKYAKLSHDSPKATELYATFYETCMNDMHTADKLRASISTSSTAGDGSVNASQQVYEFRVSSCEESGKSLILSCSTGLRRLLHLKHVHGIAGIDVEYLLASGTGAKFARMLKGVTRTLETFDTLNEILVLKHARGFELIFTASIKPVVISGGRIVYDVSLDQVVGGDNFLLIDAKEHIYACSEEVFITESCLFNDIKGSTSSNIELMKKMVSSRIASISPADVTPGLCINPLPISDVHAHVQTYRILSDPNREPDPNPLFLVRFTEISKKRATTKRNSFVCTSPSGETPSSTETKKSLESHKVVAHARQGIRNIIESKDPVIARFKKQNLYLSVLGAIFVFVIGCYSRGLYNQSKDFVRISNIALDRSEGLLEVSLIYQDLASIGLDRFDTNTLSSDARVERFKNTSWRLKESYSPLVNSPTGAVSGSLDSTIPYGNINVATVAVANHALAYAMYEFPSCGRSCKAVSEQAFNDLFHPSVRDVQNRYEVHNVQLSRTNFFHLGAFVFATFVCIMIAITEFKSVVLHIRTIRAAPQAMFLSLPSSTIQEISITYSTRRRESQNPQKSGKGNDLNTNQITRGVSFRLSSLHSSMRAANIRKHCTLVLPKVYQQLFVTAAVLVVFLGISAFGFSTEYHSELNMRHRDVVLAGQQLLGTLELIYLIRVPFHNSRFEPIERQERMQALVHQIEDGFKILQYGNNSDDAGKKVFSDILFNDGCQLLNFSESVPVCSTNKSSNSFVATLNLRQGLHIAIQKLVAFGHAEYSNMNSTDVVFHAKEASISLEAWEYFVAAIKHMRDASIQRLFEGTDHFIALRFQYSGLVVLVLFLSHLFVLRACNKIESHTRKCLVMFLLLPESTFLNNGETLKGILSKHIK